MQKPPKEALDFIENNISNGRQFFEEEFEILEEALNRLETMEAIAKFKPEVLKRFKIELQPMKRKQLTISDCSNWREQLYEWLGVPKEVMEVL